MDGKIYAIGGSVASPVGIGISTVEEYETDFVPRNPQAIKSEGKLPTNWGSVKR